MSHEGQNIESNAGFSSVSTYHLFDMHNKKMKNKLIYHKYKIIAI